MVVLVTGAAGFIGSHICDALLAAGCKVAGVDDLRSGVDWAPPGIECWRMSVEDLAKRQGENSGADVFPDAIVHCAARADVQFNWSDRGERERLWIENMGTTIELLEAWRAPTVLLSTCAVYGDTPDDRTSHEDEACVATSPYAASKLACEAMVQAYCEHRKMPWHVLRLGCVVGARYHHGHIAEFVERYKRDGKLEARSSGPLKSFVHALDVASMVRMCVADPGTDSVVESGVYNLHGGLWSAQETVRVMGIQARTEWPRHDHGWSGDTVPCVSADKATRAGWRNSHGVEQGVREALAGLGWPS